MSDEDRNTLAAIMQMIIALDKKVSERFTVVDNHVEAIQLMVEAFPHTDGVPDFRGHRNDHDTRIESGKTWASTIQAIRNKAAEILVLMVFGIIMLGLTSWRDQQRAESAAQIVQAQKQINDLVERVNKTVTENHVVLKGNK